ncbi:rhomboid family intramembrane serine protease [Nocardiopsis sp. RSe5-2]|uniref:Rhomboid family intramembrane serine protease n=1 Tax=Nocardiopsis endophytica TaxID=3018445 RepID=A0ABT4UCT1_9ACTN|nr:rhomboid family intramembrane serine protease [Nocardiopsis endophytica]MDA2814160.1 rhomboid family intramembrane serine protease [Nocardiopsis endophytica]
MAGIPLSDDYPVRRVPAVTYLLIAANVAVYLASPMSLMAVWYGGDLGARICAVDHYIFRWGAVPLELFTGEQAASSAPCPGEPAATAPWLTVFTSMFLHGDALHLLSNMVYLFVFGPVVEDRLGRVRYTGLYLASGAVATLAFALTDPAAQVPLVGASGAISGVLGAYLVVQFRSRVITLVFFVLPVRLPGWALVGTYFVLQYVLYISVSLYPGAGETSVAYAAHVYGFVAGAAMALLIHRIRWRAGTRLSDVY